MLRVIALSLLLVTSSSFGQDWTQLDSVLDPNYRPRNVLPPFRALGAPKDLPVGVAPYEVHVRGTDVALPDGSNLDAVATVEGTLYGLSGERLHRLGANAEFEVVSTSRNPEASAKGTARAQLWRMATGTKNDSDDTAGLPSDVMIHDVLDSDTTRWIATDRGLYRHQAGKPFERHDSYGVDGPLATTVTALAMAGDGTLWVGTPIGISIRETDGTWRSLSGRDGLPYEDVTALAMGDDDTIWIGTRRGVVQYRPNATGRKWFYRAGPRYLPGDDVGSLALSADGKTVYVATSSGVGTIQIVSETLRGKADAIEARLNERHRRMGMVASSRFPDPEDLSTFIIPDNDNDGLWTAYHVTAMSLAYATTDDPAHKASAREGMHALYMLQNASGTPGLTARSVVLPEEGLKKRAQAKDDHRRDRREQWRPTPDGELYWKSDTSSDEYCGHYMAFYAYWEHIAKADDDERDLCIKQVRQMTDYLLANNYQLIDWDGEHTTWGFWDPESLNESPSRYIENGLNALQICSFLNTAFHITGDAKYREHYLYLMQEHDYLSNILLEKKLFPDEVNHSDDQLGFTAWYPILQTERDPKIRQKLHQAVRRHWMVEEPERPSYFTFIYATIDPNHADIDGAILNLMEIPEDRRTWRMENSHRADVTFDPRDNRFDKRVLRECLPADERNFEKWNADPFVPDGGDQYGSREDDGAAYLLPYWMGRYHGFFAEE